MTFREYNILRLDTTRSHSIYIVPRTCSYIEQGLHNHHQFIHHSLLRFNQRRQWVGSNYTHKVVLRQQQPP